MIQTTSSGFISIVETGAISINYNSFNIYLINGIVSIGSFYADFFPTTGKAINDGLFQGIENPADICSKQNLEIQNNVSNIIVEEDVNDDDYNPFA
jgi:hypothetical protein